MKETLLAFIAAAQREAADGKLHTNFCLNLTSTQFPAIWFGAGLQDHRTVVLWTDPDNYEQAPPEVAVDALLASLPAEP